jgi:hypothetical protein
MKLLTLLNFTKLCENWKNVELRNLSRVTPVNYFTNRINKFEESLDFIS